MDNWVLKENHMLKLYLEAGKHFEVNILQDDIDDNEDSHYLVT